MNNTLKTILILTLGGVLGFGICWWMHRHHDEKCEHHHGHKECKHKDKDCKKHCDNNDNGLVGDCNQMGFGDSGKFITTAEANAAIKLYNNGKPKESPTRNLGGNFHYSLLNQLIASTEKTPGPERYISYYYGLFQKTGSLTMDTAIILFGGKDIPNCPRFHYMISTTFCPQICKNRGGD